MQSAHQSQILINECSFARILNQASVGTLIFYFFLLYNFFKMSSEVTVSFIDRKKTSHDIIALNFDCLTIYDNLHHNGELIYSTSLKRCTLLYCICLVLTFLSRMFFFTIKIYCCMMYAYKWKCRPHHFEPTVNVKVL